MRSQPNGDLAGVRVLLDGAGDTQPAVPLPRRDPMLRGPVVHDGHRHAVTARFNDYTMEVVQQIGSDSFAPGHGVLIGKTKTSSSTCGSYNCFVWYIDSNPQDINQVDYVQGRRHAGQGDARRRAPDQRRLVQRRRRTRAASTSTSPPATSCTSTSSTSAPMPRASCATRSASARPRAPVRRRAASALGSPTAGTAEGFTTCTFPLKNTGAAAATAGRAPAGRLGVPRQRHLPPVGLDAGARLGGAPQERARHREVR